MRKALTHFTKTCLEGELLAVDEATRKSYTENGNIDRVIRDTTLGKAKELELVIRNVLGREIKSEFVPDESRHDGRGDLLVKMTFDESQKIHSSWEVIQVAMV